MPHLRFGFRSCNLFVNPHQSRRTLTASTYICRLGNVRGLATMRDAIRHVHSLRDAVVHIETPRTPEDTDDTKRVGFWWSLANPDFDANAHRALHQTWTARNLLLVIRHTSKVSVQDQLRHANFPLHARKTNSDNHPTTFTTYHNAAAN